MIECQHCGHIDLYTTPTRAILCGWCGRKQDRLTYTDDQLLSMEWPDDERYQSCAAFNEQNGRDLLAEEYDRLRKLTNAPAPKATVDGVTYSSKADVMAGIARILG